MILSFSSNEISILDHRWYNRNIYKTVTTLQSVVYQIQLDRTV